MKKHITPKQARQLTKEQFYDMYNSLAKNIKWNGLHPRDDWSTFHHKKIDIGFMLEYLYAMQIDLSTVDMHVNSDCEFDIVIKCANINNMCDALWDMIVYLNQEED